MIRRCEICERPLPQSSGRGRPRLYHPECKDYRDRFLLLQIAIPKLKLTHKAAAQLAGELMDLRNAVQPHIDKEARKRFGHALRNGREARGLTQAELADQTGLQRKQVSRFELGEAEPSRQERQTLLAYITEETQ